ncbi:hypothetical protein E3N88_00016 [Mikania micrantha]|uniref:Uncharacterized protein n=1 Tax=Mikania micrantha TaxID=192012 RepID=A0A5N6PZM1_9ASTR|nr:hypothetical protein E3N88_00016 [Mikania micrantha]
MDEKLKGKVGVLNLKNSVNNISKQQIKTIIGMGFKPFLSLAFDTISTRLAHWLVSNYNCDRDELNAGNHIIKIASGTVKDVLGTLLGKITVNEKKKKKPRIEYPKKSRIVKDVLEQLKKGKLLVSNRSETRTMSLVAYNIFVHPAFLKEPLGEFRYALAGRAWNNKVEYIFLVMI